MKIDLLDPVVEASPGQTALCRVRVLNDSAGPSAYRLRVVGLYEVDIEYPLGLDPLPAGTTAHFDVNLDVPKEFAAGRHSLAVEITSDRRDERPVLAGMTVDVSSIQKVAMRVNPGSIKGRLKGKFKVEIDNHEDRIVDLDLTGQGQDLEVTFGRDRVRLRPGDSVSINGTVRGESRLVRDPVNHVVTIAATGRSAPVFADAAYHQRPVFPRRLRGAMAVIALLGLWAGIVGGGAYWYTQRDVAKVTGTANGLDTNGDGVADQPLGSLGQPGPDIGPEAEGGAGGAGSDGSPGAEDEAAAGQGKAKPESAIVTGTVKAGDTGENGDVTISIAPTTLGGQTDQTPAQQASLARGGGGDGGTGTAKIWPARYNRAVESGVSERRSTESIQTRTSDGEGVWMFPEVLIPDNYEITFAKPGFDTQAFIITPPEDGTTVELEVVLEPGAGGASGIVTGPDGPLGGVDIVITDGVLTFNTTSSSETNAVGTWSVAGLSTPNTYTLTATLRGFGTQVQQIKLDPGVTRTGIGIKMTAGVGTISGHISANAAPLGGVTITASSGDLTRSTTSLTLGDGGSYSLPQLKIPGTYTITAQADGYMTQTRDLFLGGNAPDIDFTMIRTTGSISGLVVSDILGNLVGVGITVAHEDLKFTSTTAVAPSAGTFLIQDLPPGEYLVTFNRFDHADVSQLVTIDAGESKEFGTVAMKFQTQKPLVETGRLVVTVFDSATVPIGGATVQVLKISDGSIVRQTTDTTGTESSFAFDNLPIGTYSVRVVRSSYRTTSQRVTMGLSEIPIKFNLLQLGQVTGRVVDSLSVATGGAVEQLKNYEIRIYRLRVDGTRDGVEIERIVVKADRVKDGDQNILWESSPASLTDGKYEVEVTVPPLGYGVTPNQKLDPGDPTAIMRFTVDPKDEGTIRLNDIKADPLPTLSGRIYVPRLIDDDPTDIGFDPLDADAEVKLTCTDSAGEATATLTNEIGGAGLDTYTITPIQLDQQDLLGDCTLNVSSNAFKTVDIAVGTPLEVSSAGIDTDRIVNIAISKVANDITGEMYWLDTGRTPNVPIPVDTVNVITEGTVITGFAAAPPGGNGLPTPIVSTTATVGQNLSGDWNIASHVFGRTTYVFSGDDDFRIGKLAITVDEVKRTVVVVQNLSVVDPNASDLQVQLQPLPGSIVGTVETFPTGTNPALAVSANSPAGVVTTASSTTTGIFSFDNAAAGTWDLAYTAPTGYRFKDTGLTTSAVAPFLLDPTEAFTDSPKLVEMASLEITVQSTELDLSTIDPLDREPLTGAPPVVTLRRVATITPGDPGDDASIPITLDSQNHVIVPNLPVNWVDPIGKPAAYFVTVTKAGYDTETVEVKFDSLTPVEASGANISTPLTAGTHRVMTISLGRFGSISGNVLGSVPWANPAGVGSVQPDLVSPTMTVTAVRKFTLGNTVNSYPPGPPATVTFASNLNDFVIVGPPGYYEITVSHPSYQSPPLIAPPGEIAVPVSGLYRLGNVDANAIGSFVLRVIPSAINVRAVDGNDQPVSGALITVTDGPTTVTGSLTTALDGRRIVGNLAEGTYTVEVRKLNGLVNERFPVKVMVTLDHGETEDARSVDLTVKLVALDGTISGTLGAVNSLIPPRPVALPASVDITRTYTVGTTADVEDIGASQNLNTASTQTITVTPGVPPVLPSAPQIFTFSNLPRGLHRLTFSSAAGYVSPTGTPDAPIPLTEILGNHAVSTGQINYVANNVTVAVNVLAGTVGNPPLTNATAVIVPSYAPGTSIPPNNGVNGVGGLFTFSVPPDLDTYSIRVTHPLHDDASETITVSPSTVTFDAPTITMTATKSNITGVAKKQESPDLDSIVPLVSQGAISLLPETGTTPVAGTASGPTNDTGNYTFTGIAGTGPFRIRVVLANHVTMISDPFSVIPGEVATAPEVIVPKLATATITLNSAAPGLSKAPTGTTSPVTSAGVCTLVKCDFTGLDPSVLYTFTIQPATDADPVKNDIDFYWPATTTVAPAIGTNSPLAVTMRQRDLTFNVVTNPAADGQTATVDLRIPTTANAISKTNTNSIVYTFIRARRGAGEVRVTLTNYLTQTVPVAADPGPDTEPATPITMVRALTDVTGTITGLPFGYAGVASVRATLTTPPATVINGTVTGSTFTIDDLTWGSWIVSVDAPGAGTGSNTTPVVVDGAAASTVVRNVGLTPRSYDYDFFARTVSAGAGIGNITITMGTDSEVTDDSGSDKGDATLTVLETLSRSWTAAGDGFITQTDPTGPALATTDTTTVRMVPIPAIGGNVTGGVPTAGVTFDNVLLCRPAAIPAPSTDQCTTTGSDFVASASTVSGSTGEFTFNVAVLRLLPGAYRVKAIKGTQTVEQAITIVAAGTAIPAITLNIAPRSFNYEFNVRNAADVAVADGATVTMGGQTGLTVGGKVTLLVSEFASRAWTVAANGFITKSDPVGPALGSLAATTPVPVPMVAIPAIAGVVNGGAAPGAPVAFDTVLMCPGVSPFQCSVGGPGVIVGTAGAGVGTFSFSFATVRLAPGDYRVTAIIGAVKATSIPALVITASGTAIPAISITFPP